MARSESGDFFSQESQLPYDEGIAQFTLSTPTDDDGNFHIVAICFDEGSKS